MAMTIPTAEALTQSAANNDAVKQNALQQTVSAMTAAAQAGQYSVIMPDYISAEVRTYVKNTLGYYGYTLGSANGGFGLAISWPLPPDVPDVPEDGEE